jgi:hypothetical protein
MKIPVKIDIDWYKSMLLVLGPIIRKKCNGIWCPHVLVACPSSCPSIILLSLAEMGKTREVLNQRLYSIGPHYGTP